MAAHERRRDPDLRRLMERAAQIGAEKALASFADQISPHDVSTHDGRMALRADLYHAGKLRRICESLKSQALKTVVGAVVLGGLGAIWAAVTHFGRTPFAIAAGAVVLALALWAAPAFGQA